MIRVVYFTEAYIRPKHSEIEKYKVCQSRTSNPSRTPACLWILYECVSVLQNRTMNSHSSLPLSFCFQFPPCLLSLHLLKFFNCYLLYFNCLNMKVQSSLNNSSDIVFQHSLHLPVSVKMEGSAH